MKAVVNDETGRFMPVAPGWEVRVHYEELDGTSSTQGPQPMIGWLLVDADGESSYAPAVYGLDGFIEGVQVSPIDAVGRRIDMVDVLVTGGGGYEPV